MFLKLYQYSALFVLFLVRKLLRITFSFSISLSCHLELTRLFFSIESQIFGLRPSLFSPRSNGRRHGSSPNRETPRQCRIPPRKHMLVGRQLLSLKLPSLRRSLIAIPSPETLEFGNGEILTVNVVEIIAGHAGILFSRF